MTRYSRSVIPGRTGQAASDVDSLVFGNRAGGPMANEEDGDEAPPSKASPLADHAASDRAKVKSRRKFDFAPLPGEAAAYKRQVGSMRGPILLANALVIVGVFGVVVWNAYRDGVRPEDAALAPQLAEAGAFKFKPDAPSASNAAAEATVFDQVEGPKPLAAPAPEVREAPVARPAAEPAPDFVSVAKAAEPARPAPAKTAPDKSAPAKTASDNTAPANPGLARSAATPARPAKVTPIQLATATIAQTPELAGAAPMTLSGGKFTVQIAAASSQEGGAAEWSRHSKKAPELFASAEKSIVQADVNGRTVYRVRAGSFAIAADADAFCTAFKARGGECFRVAK